MVTGPKAGPYRIVTLCLSWFKVELIMGTLKLGGWAGARAAPMLPTMLATRRDPGPALNQPLNCPGDWGWAPWKLGFPYLFLMWIFCVKVELRVGWVAWSNISQQSPLLLKQSEPVLEFFDPAAVLYTPTWADLWPNRDRAVSFLSTFWPTPCC